MLDLMFMCSAPPITSSLLRLAGFNQIEKEDLSPIICSASLFNPTKTAPRMCYGLYMCVSVDVLLCVCILWVFLLGVFDNQSAKQ